MIVGFDYWQVLSHWPEQIGHLIEVHERSGDEVHVISAIGHGRIGTVEAEVRRLSPVPEVHEVVWSDSTEAPVLKLDKCRELGITLFYDDRQDVCDELTRNGILALRVPRRDDIEAVGAARGDAESDRI